ncbi:MAG: transposase family protein [Limnoraphis robusta]
MLNSIISQLKLVKDFRKNRGKRHELWVVLTIIILALLTGNVTYKQIDNFRKNETLYYISSHKLSAKTFAEKIKEHWLIENQVHWGGMGAEPASAH